MNNMITIGKRKEVMTSPLILILLVDQYEDMK